MYLKAIGILILLPFLGFAQTIPGTVVWSEDFNSGLPLNWQVVNNNGNNVVWVWDTIYRQGGFSNCQRRLNSTTASNGFMQLPMDWYNTPGSPLPITCDTYMATSVNVPSNADLILRFQQFVRYCCSSQSALEVQLSGDNITWSSFDVKNSLMNNQIGQNEEEVSIAIPNFLLTSGTLYIRFYASAFSHYFWMIDDVEIVHAYSSAASIETVERSFGVEPQISTVETTIPAQMMDTMSVNVAFRNRGTLAQSVVKLRSRVFLNNGSNTLVQSDSNSYMNLAVDELANLSIKSQNVLTIQGDYRAEMEVFTTPTNQLSNRKKKVSYFSISDTVLSKNRAINDCWQDYELKNNRKLGTVYKLGSKAGRVTSISAYVGSMSLQVGTYVKAELWTFNSSAPTLAQQLGTLIATSAIDTLSNTQLSSWMNFPLLNPSNLNPNSEYLAVISHEGGVSQLSTFSAPVYFDNYKNNPNPDSYVYDPTTATWDTVYSSFYVDMNFGNLTTVGLSEEAQKSSVTIYPNPSSGVLNIKAPAPIERVQVVDMKGQIVGTQIGNENTVNLTENGKGLYLIRVWWKGGVVAHKVLLE